jgi:hypothetical protein
MAKGAAKQYCQQSGAPAESSFDGHHAPEQGQNSVAIVLDQAALLELSLPKLVALLDSKSALAQVAAARALCNLAKDNASRKAIVAVPGCLQGLAGLLGSKNADVQLMAATVLWYLMINDDANKKAIAAEPGCLQGLVGLLGSKSARSQQGVGSRASALRDLAVQHCKPEGHCGGAGKLAGAGWPAEQRIR